MKPKKPLLQAVRIPEDVISHSTNTILDMLRITWAGYFSFAENHYVKRETFNEFLMFYCVDGHGFLNMSSKNWQIKEGDVAFCFKGLEHEYGANSSNPWTIYWAHFDGQAVSSFFKNLAITPEKPVIHISRKLQVISLFSEILDTLRSGYHPQNLIHSSVCFQHILSAMAVDVQSHHIITGNITVNDIVEFMIKNIYLPLTLDEMANFANMSKFNFSRVFRNNIGCPPMNYFIRLKILKACELLNTTDMRIREVAYKLGYDDEYYFSKLFKKIMGVSPMLYKKRQGI